MGKPPLLIFVSIVYWLGRDPFKVENAGSIPRGDAYADRGANWKTASHKRGGGSTSKHSGKKYETAAAEYGGPRELR